METPEEIYDEQEIFDTQILSLLSQIRDICKQYRIPWFSLFCYKQLFTKDGRPVGQYSESHETFAGRNPRLLQRFIRQWYSQPDVEEGELP